MNSISSLVLPPFSALYGLLTRARLIAYREGLLETSKLDAPVISIGNITTGGTGKTPLVEWVSRAIAAEGKRVCVLTRGYRRANPGKRLVVSDGQQILAGVEEAGDEPLLLARKLKGLAAVVCDSDRWQAGNWAQKNLAVDAFVLDDGFQHFRLARNLDIVTIDATSPYGGANLLPYGQLREPLSAASRSDCIIITRSEFCDDLDELKRHLQSVSADRPIFISEMRAEGFRTIDALNVDLESIPKAVAAFCGVGNPESFYAHLKRQQFTLTFTHSYRDHHAYTQTDIDFLARQATQSGAKALVTTAKDAVKLESLNLRLPCFVLEIEIAIEEGANLLKLIRRAL